MSAPPNPLPIAVVLEAVRDHGIYAYEHLVGLGHNEKRVYTKMQGLVDRGYLECGVSARRAWLTERGAAMLLGTRPVYRTEIMQRAVREAAERGERVLVCCASEADGERYAGIQGVELSHPGSAIRGQRAVMMIDEVGDFSDVPPAVTDQTDDGAE